MAVRVHCPEVLESLATDLLPAYQRATDLLPAYQRSGPASEEPPPFEELPALVKTALRDWSTEYNLTDSWIREHVITTVHTWRIHPTWARTWRVEKRNPGWIFADTTIKGKLIREPRALAVTLRLQPWDPWFPEIQTWSEFRRDAIRQLDEQLAPYRTQVEKSAGKRPSGTVPGLPALEKHLEWLVLRQVAAMSVPEIWKREQHEQGTRAPDDQRTIGKAIATMAERIGLTPRPPEKGGRPPAGAP